MFELNFGWFSGAIGSNFILRNCQKFFFLGVTFLLPTNTF